MIKSVVNKKWFIFTSYKTNEHLFLLHFANKKNHFFGGGGVICLSSSDEDDKLYYMRNRLYQINEATAMFYHKNFTTSLMLSISSRLISIFSVMKSLKGFMAWQ